MYRRLVALDQARGLSLALDARRGRPPREKVIQDVEIPLAAAADFLAFFAQRVGMSPVWLCPLRLRSPRPWPLYPLRPGELYVNAGFWGTMPLPPGRGDGYYNRLIEEKVAALGGHKGLYSTSFYSEDEFWARYNGQAYHELKNHDLKERHVYYVASFSTRIIIYKGQLTSKQVVPYFPESRRSAKSWSSKMESHSNSSRPISVDLPSSTLPQARSLSSVFTPAAREDAGCSSVHRHLCARICSSTRKPISTS